MDSKKCVNWNNEKKVSSKFNIWAIQQVDYTCCGKMYYCWHLEGSKVKSIHTEVTISFQCHLQFQFMSLKLSSSKIQNRLHHQLCQWFFLFLTNWAHNLEKKTFAMSAWFAIPKRRNGIHRRCMRKYSRWCHMPHITSLIKML